MSNNRNDRVTDEDATKKYLDKMLKNAEKHGIKINLAVYQTLIGHGYIVNGSNKFSDIPAMLSDITDAILSVKKDFEKCSNLREKEIISCWKFF